VHLKSKISDEQDQDAFDRNALPFKKKKRKNDLIIIKKKTTIIIILLNPTKNVFCDTCKTKKKKKKKKKMSRAPVLVI
jgi:hypothetical protein